MGGITDLRSATECVEHVEEDETGEGHSCVSRSHFVVTHLKHQHTIIEIFTQNARYKFFPEIFFKRQA